MAEAQSWEQGVWSRGLPHGGNGWPRGKEGGLHEPRVWAALTALSESRKVWMKKEMRAWVERSPEKIRGPGPLE